jgi:hypothetical protein
VLPQIGIVVDGVARTNFFLTSTNLTHYTVTLSLSAGTHAVGLAFLNDFYAPPEDRNAFFDWFSVAVAPTLRIVDFNANRLLQTASLQWESVPGKSYEVQVATNPAYAVWQAAAMITNDSTLANWRDTGDVSRPPPLSPAAPQRYYRIRQTGP